MGYEQLGNSKGTELNRPLCADMGAWHGEATNVTGEEKGLWRGRIVSRSRLRHTVTATRRPRAVFAARGLLRPGYAGCRCRSPVSSCGCGDGPYQTRPPLEIDSGKKEEVEKQLIRQVRFPARLRGGLPTSVDYVGFITP